MMHILVNMNVGVTNEVDPQVADNMANNSVPRWNGATTQLVTGNIYNDPNSGNVGIGTASPGYPLDVNGVIHGNRHIQLTAYPGYGTGEGDFYYDNTGGINTIRFNPSIRVNGNAYIAGNVGIGIASPGYKLHVAGDIYANGGWLRTSGNQGWYSESYGGGWYMQDTSWIRGYNGKSLWMAGGYIGGDGGLTVGYGGASPSGGGAIIAGNVGIGTPAPAAKLDVNGDARISGNVGIGTTPPSGIKLDVNGVAIVRGGLNVYSTVVIPYSYLGVGTGFPQHPLEVQGDAWINGTIYIRDYEFISSDDRIKFNEQKLEYGLDTVMALETWRYDRAEWEVDPETEEIIVHPEKTKSEIGLVAQEVQKVIPEAVNIPENENSELWSVSYSTIIPVLVKAVQEQQAQIEELKKEIKAIKSGI